MCLGLPMRIVETDGLSATVEGLGERRTVSLLLVGEQPKGVALLVHQGNAVRVLDEAEVPLLEKALQGLAAAFEGRALDGYFDDLDRKESARCAPPWFACSKTARPSRSGCRPPTTSSPAPVSGC